MGIPSYFSHIIKNHRQIIKTLAAIKTGVQFDAMFMDCNSIIYDVYYKYIASAATASPPLPPITHDYIIIRVIAMIELYVKLIQPSRLVYIAFDGVAPAAKMEQQRTRRYKSWFTANLPTHNTNTNNVLDSDKTPDFVTAEITPGTQFMDRLSVKIAAHFSSPVSSNITYIISGSNIPGEGEHKMFQYIRQNVDVLSNQNIAVYGLDSDLIMLSLFHCFIKDIAKNTMSQFPMNIYIFRESSEFVKSIAELANKDNENEPYFLDIRLLALSILRELTGKPMISEVRDISRIYDYVFLCFLLGNDFLPHFPAMNIRTHGINVLLETYRLQISHFPARAFIINGKIAWQWVLHYIKELAKHEHEWLVQEIVVRDKMDSRTWSHKKDHETMLNNAPIIHREKEKYISVKEDGWQSRYYRALFHEQDVKDICVNYLEGLEWVFKYYTTECADWQWKYKYHYPPLLCDLQKYVPNFNMDFIKNGSQIPTTPGEQLMFVLPPAYSHLLPEDKRRIIEARVHPVITFEWSFCRYFWESHVNIE